MKAKLNFENAPSYQDVCDTRGVLALDDVGISEDKYGVMKVLIDDNGTPVLGIPKVLVISGYPENDTLASKAKLLCQGEDVIIREGNQHQSERKLDPQNAISMIFDLLDEKVFTYPPLIQAEKQELAAIPEELLKTGAVDKELYDYLQHNR